MSSADFVRSRLSEAEVEALRAEITRLDAARIEAERQRDEARGYAPAGWIYDNPDTGTEVQPQHPVESGECPDAENVREATADALLVELQHARSDERIAIAQRDVETERADAALSRVKALEEALRGKLDALRTEIKRPTTKGAHAMRVEYAISQFEQIVAALAAEQEQR